MNKISKTILISSIIIFGAALLLVNSAQAQVDELVVDFENTPLFDEANFLPGESVTRWVKVTNNSGQPQRITTEAINYPGFPDSDNVPANDLSRALSIIIREKAGADLYGGLVSEKSLFNFYQDGETYLSDISSGAGGVKEYEFEILFPTEKENQWQGATTTFDILVGYQRAAGGVPPGTPPGGGGGGGGPLGLTVKYEKEIYITTTTATISWFTSYDATSRVIYSQDGQSHNFDLMDVGDDPPLYGYVYTTPEYHTPAIEHGVTYREITITGLLPNTTYYFRCISHASPPTISREHSFTTLAIEQEQEDQRGDEESEGEGEQVQAEPKGIVEEIVSLAGSAVDLITGTGSEADEKEEDLDQELVSLEPTEDPSIGSSNLLAAIGGLTFDLKAWFIIIGVALLAIFFLKMIKKRKRD